MKYSNNMTGGYTQLQHEPLRWESPQSTQNETQPSVKIAPPNPDTYSFVPDAFTKELLSMTYPELTNALVNIAIKKMAETSDFHDYFIKNELKERAEQLTPKNNNEEESQETPSQQSNPGVVDFSSW
jgi:hypothetical protein